MVHFFSKLCVLLITMFAFLGVHALVGAAIIGSGTIILPGGTAYQYIPLQNINVSQNEQVAIITYIPKYKRIGINASTYYGFTKINDSADPLGELNSIKENMKENNLPGVGAKRSRIIGKTYWNADLGGN